MSDRHTDLGYKKDIGRCKLCKAVILWGYMFGKKHPFDVSFDENGNHPRKAGSHMDTCPNWKSGGLKARADAHTAAIEKWCESCKLPESHPPVDWKTVVLLMSRSDTPNRSRGIWLSEARPLKLGIRTS